MSKSRAERRHHHQRMLNKIKDYRIYQFEWHDETWKELHMKKTVENRKPCSCYMCGNPRKHWKDKTIQEKRFDEYEIE